MLDLETVALGAAIVGFVAWIVTNVHLWRAARAIRKASDDRWVEVQAAVDKRLADLDGRMNAKIESLKNVSFDAGPIVAAIMERMGPDFDDKLGRLKSWWEGKRGAVTKALSDLGEGGLEAAAAKAAEDGDLSLEEALAASMVVDPEWAKRHPYAYTGLRYLQKNFLGDGGKVKLTRSRKSAGGRSGEFG